MVFNNDGRMTEKTIYHRYPDGTENRTIKDYTYDDKGRLAETGRVEIQRLAKRRLTDTARYEYSPESPESYNRTHEYREETI